MANLKVPVRWWGGAGNDKIVQSEDGHCYAELELELARTVFMIVDSDCGQGNVYVEEGIAPALAAARAVGMQVVYIHNDFSLSDEPGSIKREIHGTRWGNEGEADRSPRSHPIIRPRLHRCRTSPTSPNASGPVSTRRMSIIIYAAMISRISSLWVLASALASTRP